MRIRTSLLVTLVLAAAACGGETAATTTTPSTTTLLQSTTTGAGAATTTEVVTTTMASATTTTVLRFEVSVQGGQVQGPGRIDCTVGQELSVTVVADTDDEIHVHGYDLRFPVTAGVPTEISLTPDVPGIFEVELESSHTLLFELEVSP
jgi:hypothetical protein